MPTEENEMVEENNQEQTENQEETLEFTQSELDKLVDTRIDKALNKAKSKWEKDAEDRIEKAKDEAARLAKLSKDEREKEEQSKREKELADREKNIRMAELKIETRTQLTENGLPETFCDLVLAEDAEQIQANITEIRKAFDGAVEKEVNKRLSQDTPKKGANNTSMTTAEIMAITDTAERQRLIAANKNLFI